MRREKKLKGVITRNRKTLYIPFLEGIITRSVKALYNAFLKGVIKSFQNLTNDTKSARYVFLTDQKAKDV